MLHKLSDLPDLELAALVALLGELKVAAHGLGTGARAMSGALNEAVGEALGRRSGAAHRERLFRADRPVRFAELAQFRELVERGADALTERSFDAAAAVLRVALDTEVLVDTSTCRPRTAAELRHLN